MQADPPSTPPAPVAAPPEHGLHSFSLGLAAAESPAIQQLAGRIDAIQRQTAETHAFMQLIAAAQRSPPHTNVVPVAETKPTAFQLLERGSESGSFRLGSAPQDRVPLYPSSLEEWNTKLQSLLDKKVWTMGDMITATLGYFSFKRIHSMDLANMIVSKIREMAASEYGTVFEEMVNSGDPTSYWCNLVVGANARMGRIVERRPFSAPRSFSPKDHQPKAVSAKKEKK